MKDKGHTYLMSVSSHKDWLMDSKVSEIHITELTPTLLNSTA